MTNEMCWPLCKTCFLCLYPDVDIVYDILVLFDSQLADKASSMPHEQRKVHAEKVTVFTIGCIANIILF